ncbi:hypothetical protein PFFVO_02698 [Plasmodium falciparum Vietnam Oak-Knoll (FVO)]|uniref:EMP1-trafficking protein n=1 Tax=Plasmodium falciparum Vietnam Oak-Knoll (FVO) TaxID=1036723 RepID=A0A024V6N5_PLAFA|nr:hypothetical protein PFFVO_02698 [Plasmodium falciparum Vietnam Oak-Knoll (FVO)]
MENIINKKNTNGGNSNIFVLLKYSIYTILLWIVTITYNNYTYNGYNNDGSKQVRCKRLLSEPAVEFDTIFDVFKESFLDQMGCSDQDKDEIKNAMKIYYDNIDMNALSNEIQTNDNFFNEFGNDVNSINKIMKTDITNEQGTSADNNTTENNVSTSQVDEQPEASTSGVERMKERSNLFANNLTEEKNDTGDIKKEENKSKPSQLDGNNHSETSSHQGEKNNENETEKKTDQNETGTKKPSKYTMNLDSPLLKGSSEGETSSKKAQEKSQEESNVATKKPSKYTLNLDSPLLKSETKSDVKRGSNKSFSLENIGKLDIGSLLAQNLELLKGFALNFQTLSLFFLVFVGQFYPKHFQKAAIFIGMVNVFLECKRLYGRSQKKLK